VSSVDDVLAQLAEATAGLTAGISGLTAAEAREPSLLPNWTRGHVLTHLARNAEGGTRLLNWALTGVPGYEYPSVDDRAAAIEAGAGRLAAPGHLDDRRADPSRHGHTVPPGRGADPPRRPRPRVRPRLLARPVRRRHAHDHRRGRSTARRPAAGAPRCVRHGRSFQIGSAAGAIQIRGAEADLLAWLIGRSDGAGLSSDYPGPLPPVPSIYRT
jgi:maleylpyruvate isomerase